MKKIKFFAAALGLLTFAACSNSDDVFTGSEDLAQEALQDNAITFGTYTGQQAQTRAAATGSIGNDELKTNGFGVFAMYTNAQTYQEANGNKTTSSAFPNFMWNQLVSWDNGTSSWTYTPLKYWPNDIADGAVDAQTPDAATGSVANGGKISFFAYAPYANAVGSDGITVLPSKSTAGDPTISYVIPKTGKIVDLLWGTLDGTGENVLGTPNSGVSSDATAPGAGNPEVTWPIPDAQRNADGGYAKDILRGYTVNADLTKQKVSGKVGFAFKHALAKIGGSAGAGATQTGFQVALDIDNTTHAATPAKDDNTVVTISDITIKSKESQYIDATGTKAAAWITGGTFNLATGKWTITTGSSSDQITHQITTLGTESTAAAQLATSIAEPATVSGMSIPSGTAYQVNGTVEGVTTTLKNVYENEANPFVFIPGTIPSFEITVTYLVRTFDSNLDASASGGEGGTWTKVTQTIKKNVTFTKPVELNKQYNLTMYLGLTSVKFKASVSAWEQGDTNGDGTINADDKTAVDLPLNVN